MQRTKYFIIFHIYSHLVWNLGLFGWTQSWYPGDKAFGAPDHGCSSTSADACAIFPLKCSSLQIFWCDPKHFLSCRFFWQNLAKKKFSLIASPFTKRTLAISWACPLISVDSASCNANLLLMRILSKTTL